ncbi:MAG: DUF1416 domain-containing protein [Actinomycetota bacterium]|nr:DUF1416 domain-containing protein [Actinomycetota bacterium]
MAQPKIAGTVTKEGRPLGGAYVRLIGPSGDFVSEQYTKDDGAFTFHVAPGAWTIEAKAANSAEGRTVAEVSDGINVVALDLRPV